MTSREAFLDAGDDVGADRPPVPSSVGDADHSPQNAGLGKPSGESLNPWVDEAELSRDYSVICLKQLGTLFCTFDLGSMAIDFCNPVECKSFSLFSTENKSTEATDEYLVYVVRRLSQPLPGPWWSTSWKLRREFYQDAPDARGNAVMVNGIPEELDNGRSLLRMAGWPGGLKLERADGQSLHNIMSMEENDLFVDLLNIMLKYDPKERPTAEQVLQHPWFKFRSEE
ncbi:uncharacterized protein BDV14DRAFT_202912 [Aspergillus stella-maris]|uniref:uncharacterized protein n=1 Tax=Aspergillus stella-maris TaxID=1810926 RepID=UPI003CCDFB43